MLGIIGVILALICVWVAQDKNRNPWLWGFLGIMLPLVSLIILLCLPTVTKWEEEHKSNASPKGEDKMMTEEKEECDQAIRDMPVKAEENNPPSELSIGTILLLVGCFIFVIIVIVTLASGY